MNVIAHTPLHGVAIDDGNDNDRRSILPSSESIAYKRMLSMLGFDVEVPEESSKEEDSEKFNMTDYVVSTL